MLVETDPVASSAAVSPASGGPDAAVFAFLLDAWRHSVPGALVSISAVDGGAPKALGAHMAVLADGRHVGHISGGCVEPAIAAEIAPMVTEGRDRIIRFGKASCFIDIRFPCGGGVDLLVHARPEQELLAAALAGIARREPFSIAFDPTASSATLSVDASRPTAWRDGAFVRRYQPMTRLVVAGRGPDFEVFARVAAAAGMELELLTPDPALLPAVAGLGRTHRLTSPRDLPALPRIDPWTATVLLFHEHEWEDALLAHAVGADGFYIGALGSVRTHRLRRERLLAAGLPSAEVDRIRGPIGLVERAREPGPLALSVLAEIVAARADLDRR